MKHSFDIYRDTKTVKGINSKFFFVIYSLKKFHKYSSKFNKNLGSFTNKILNSIPQKEIIIENSLGKFSVHTHDDTIEKSTPFFEKECREWLQTSKNKYFLDIGANVGTYTVLFGNYHLCSKIFAFEPNPQIYARLKKNIKLNELERKVEAFNFGVGDKNESLNFVQELRHTGGSRFLDTKDSTEKFSSKTTNKIVAEVKNFDDIFTARAINPEKTGFIKIDVEGFEWRTLQGMKYFLSQTNRDTKIFIEIWGRNKDKQQIFDFLRMENFFLIEQKKDNYLFVKK